MLRTENIWNISELFCPGLMSEEAFSPVSYLRALLKENWTEADVGDSSPSLPACEKPKSNLHIAADFTEPNKEHI